MKILRAAPLSFAWFSSLGQCARIRVGTVSRRLSPGPHAPRRPHSPLAHSSWHHPALQHELRISPCKLSLLAPPRLPAGAHATARTDSRSQPSDVGSRPRAPAPPCRRQSKMPAARSAASFCSASTRWSASCVWLSSASIEVWLSSIWSSSASLETWSSKTIDEVLRIG